MFLKCSTPEGGVRVIHGVRFLFATCNENPVTGRDSLDEWKRSAVWSNAGRNRLVAALAADSASDLPGVLRGLGVEDRGVRLPDRPRVVLLAETAAHARCIGGLLSGWAVPNAVSDDNDDNEGRRHEPRATHAESPPGTVATLVYAARHGVGCDILVRATAGSGKLDWGQSIRGGDSTPGARPRRRRPALPARPRRRRGEAGRVPRPTIDSAEAEALAASTAEHLGPIPVPETPV